MSGGRMTECPHCGKLLDKDYCGRCYDSIATEECCGMYWCKDCREEHEQEAMMHLRPPSRTLA